MKAIRIHAYGDVDTLCYEEAPMPEPGPADIRIRVHAAAVNPVDWKIRAGYLAALIPYKMPLTLGWDVSGVVDKIGSEVTHLAVGDAVYCRPDIARDGSYAEYMVERPWALKVGSYRARRLRRTTSRWYNSSLKW